MAGKRKRADARNCEVCYKPIPAGQPTARLQGKTGCVSCTLAMSRTWAEREWPVPASWVRLLLRMIDDEVML